MNLIRSIKINKLGVAIPEKELEIIDFVKSMLSDLIPFKFDDYPESIFYMSSAGKWILEQDYKNDRMWIRFNTFWSVLENKYSMGYDDIQTLLKYMIEQAFKEKVSTPLRRSKETNSGIEQAFKAKVSTPDYFFSSMRNGIEQAFKAKVSTPYQGRYKSNTTIEEAFKQKLK